MGYPFSVIGPANGPSKKSAERGGFEPPVHCKADNGFRDRRIQPLCHLSSYNSTTDKKSDYKAAVLMRRKRDSNPRRL